MNKSEMLNRADKLQGFITCNMKIIDILEDILVDESALGSTQRAAKWLETITEEFQDQEKELAHTIDCYWNGFGWDAKEELKHSLTISNHPLQVSKNV
jgi:hypothetical protein